MALSTRRNHIMPYPGPITGQHELDETEIFGEDQNEENDSI